MTANQVAHAVRLQEAARRHQLLTYRGVQYLAKEPIWIPAKVAPPKA